MLAGTLNDVSLPEILALLSHSQKTGSVHVTGDGLRGRIDLIAGAIGMAQSRVGKLGLVRRLVARGVLDPEPLHANLAAAAATPDPDIQLVRMAYRAGAVTAEQVKDVVEAHIIDAMYELGRVESGRFRFDPCRVADLGVKRPPDSVLDDVVVRTEQWEQVRASIPAPGALVRMLPRLEQEEVAITPPTWRLLSAVDGRRTVADLVDLLGDGEFEVSNALHRLVQIGLIEVVVAIGDQHDDGAATADHVLPLELELANIRSDPNSNLSGHLDWDGPTPSSGTDDVPIVEDVPAPAAPSDDDASALVVEEPAPSDDELVADAAVADVHEPEEDVDSVEPVVAVEAVVDVADAGPDVVADPAPVPDPEQSASDDWTGTRTDVDPEDGFVDEPEVFTTVVEGDDDEDGSSAPPKTRRRSSGKVSLAAASERHGRLLPEPEPGHDAADLTRRLLEGVGKS